MFFTHFLPLFLTDDVLTICFRVFAEVEVRERRGGGGVEREGEGSQLTFPAITRISVIYLLVLFTVYACKGLCKNRKKKVVR